MRITYRSQVGLAHEAAIRLKPSGGSRNWNRRVQPREHDELFSRGYGITTNYFTIYKRSTTGEQRERARKVNEWVDEKGDVECVGCWMLMLDSQYDVDVKYYVDLETVCASRIKYLAVYNVYTDTYLIYGSTLLRWGVVSVHCPLSRPSCDTYGTYRGLHLFLTFFFTLKYFYHE